MQAACIPPTPRPPASPAYPATAKEGERPLEFLPPASVINTLQVGCGGVGGEGFSDLGEGLLFGS